MSTGAILAIAILATAILMMRFRRRWLVKINIAGTNRITSLFAGWLPGFGILTHVGRTSGKVYRTPVSPCLRFVGSPPGNNGKELPNEYAEYYRGTRI
jgi:hypothetical protein